jgi:Rps23 Pro-64 3,4-dihydroxylase Tpa1-like proline 4-hydroxylase
MTAQEILSSLSGSLMDDERILSARERELLASLLQHSKNITGSRDNAVAETIARAIGEVIAQRAYGILGSNITQRLLDPSAGLSNTTIRAHSPHPPSPSPPSPGLPTPPSPGPIPADAPKSPRSSLRGYEPRSSDVHAFQDPGPRSESVPETNPGPRGISMPQAVNLASPDGVKQADSSVALLDAPAALPGHCIVLDEFLAPAELEALMAHALASESEFQVSEVISPDIGGAVDFEYRRSRILQDLGPHRDVVLNRIQAVLPRVFEQLNHEPFPVARAEAQVTASNDGDFFRWHNDNGHGEIASREITFVYFFHREPKQFQGGELRLYDSRWEDGMYRPQATCRTVVPQQNQAILFLSSLAHEITPVECPSKAFADSRFTLNGWLHR